MTVVCCALSIEGKAYAVTLQPVPFHERTGLTVDGRSAPAGSSLNNYKPINTLPDGSIAPAGTPLQRISGRLYIQTADLFLLRLTGEDFVVRTSVLSGIEDSSLFLFNSEGVGLFGNDTRPERMDNLVDGAIIRVPGGTLDPGNYFLAVAGFNFQPVNEFGFIFPENLDAATAPTATGSQAPLSGWRRRGEQVPTDVIKTYELVLRGAEYLSNTAVSGAPGVTVVETGNTRLSADQRTDTYSVVLDGLPQSRVTVSATPPPGVDLGNGPGQPVNLVFTPGNWFEPQTITLQATDEAFSEEDLTALIRHSLSTEDSAYSGVPVRNISVGIAGTGILPGDGTPGNGTPGDGTPGNGTPGDGTPGDGTPGNGTPGDGTSGDGTPGNGTPGNGTPGNGTPGNGTPGDGTPGDGTPGNGTPGDGTPGNGTPGNGTPGDGTPGNGTPGNGTPGNGTPSNGTPNGTPGNGTPGVGLPGVGGDSPVSVPEPSWSLGLITLGLLGAGSLKRGRRQ